MFILHKIKVLKWGEKNLWKTQNSCIYRVEVNLNIKVTSGKLKPVHLAVRSTIQGCKLQFLWKIWLSIYIWYILIEQENDFSLIS